MRSAVGIATGGVGWRCNVGVIAFQEKDYAVLVRELTAERVKQYFGQLVKGKVERFELPNLNALNFLLHGALDGGGTLSLKTDAQGKVYSTALLRMSIDVPDDKAKAAGLPGKASGPAYTRSPKE